MLKRARRVPKVRRALGAPGALRTIAAAAPLATALALTLAGAAEARSGSCAGNPDAIGLARTVEIDTTGGPAFGLQQYKAYDFLRKGEIVLTFDDGPFEGRTTKILDALDAHCTKATFFPTGKQAVASPEVLKEVARRGHTIGSHTFSHKNLAKKKNKPKMEEEIETAISAVRLAVGRPMAPFFRFPYLKDSDEALAYLAKRNIAIFSMDVDSFDFRYSGRGKRAKSNAKALIKRVLTKMKKAGKGILLFHDINPTTAAAMSDLLTALNKAGYKVVHLTAKSPLKSLEKYDKKLASKFRGQAHTAGGASRPLSAVVRTVGEGEK